ncbi:MAG: tRNA (guanosine(46)-N7)-methyltransferase TrmB [Burkholderia sp.]|nr:tRNA (guanosine(46)-N7)-methyltransferase TrmB [Burkholderia sp.]
MGSNDNDIDLLHRRRIRSFVTRTGRISTGQRRAIKELGPSFIISYSLNSPDWNTVFNRTAPRILEIGFGMGITTAEIAKRRPKDDFIGIEVYEPGIGALLRLIDEQNLNNIRIIQHDAIEVIEHMIMPESLDGVHIFFPDPWYKVRHHKRRLIQPIFIRLLSSRMKSNSYIHCATDLKNYAEQILNILRAEPSLNNITKDYAPRYNYRPVTKFESRGLKLGYDIWDIVFLKH